jgi:glutamate-1-semialdehyde 2,1-aminomutase
MEAAQTSFISSAYWTERVGPAAALATIRKHRRLGVAGRLIQVGERLRAGWLAAAGTAGLPIIVFGIPPLGGFRIDAPDAAALTTLFTQEMLARGYLAGTHVYTMLPHTDALVDDYLAATAEVFRDLAAAAGGDVPSRLMGPLKHNGFQRLN